MRNGGCDEQDQDRRDDHHEWESHRDLAFRHVTMEILSTGVAQVFAQRKEGIGVAASSPCRAEETVETSCGRLGASTG